MGQKWDGKNRRNHWSRVKLKYKMPILIGVPTLTLMLAVSFISYLSAQSSLQNQQKLAFEHLLLEKSERLSYWLESVHNDIDTLSKMRTTHLALRDFEQGWNDFGDGQQQTLQRLYISENPYPTGEKDRLDQAEDGSSWSASHQTYHSDFHAVQLNGGYYDVFLFDLDGNLIYSVFKELDFATNFEVGEFADSGLGEAYRGAVSLPAGEIYSTDFAPYAPSYGAPAMFLAMSVFDAEGARIGVVALQLPVGEIGTIISDSDALGETGQVYAVGDDGLARSNSIKDGGHEILDSLPRSPQLVAALNGEDSSYSNVPGLSGAPVVAFSHSFDLFGKAWHLILEQDVREINQATNALMFLSLVQALVVMVIVAAIAFLVARMLTRRIQSLSESVNTMAQGDLENDVSQRLCCTNRLRGFMLRIQRDSRAA